jgi:hypothetical protein
MLSYQAYQGLMRGRTIRYFLPMCLLHYSAETVCLALRESQCPCSLCHSCHSAMAVGYIDTYANLGQDLLVTRVKEQHEMLYA